MVTILTYCNILKIQNHGQNDFELLIKESLIFKHLKPNLNNIDSLSLTIF